MTISVLHFATSSSFQDLREFYFNVKEKSLYAGIMVTSVKSTEFLSCSLTSGVTEKVRLKIANSLHVRGFIYTK